jgi:hypothetical protein
MIAWGDIVKAFLLAVTLLAAMQIEAVAVPTLDIAGIDAALGRSGQLMDGGVYRVAFPRTDLDVRVGTLKIAAGLALGSYAAFVPMQNGTLIMGDLVLLEKEIQPVTTALERSGLQITAIHNHLRSELPHVMYVHFMGRGNAASLAKDLRAALALSATPLSGQLKTQPQILSFQSSLEQSIGRPGKVSGAVLSISAPRAEAITLDGVTIPPAAGVATVMNFADAGGGRVATTGDFVMIGSEVQPVERSLLAHGFEITALHSHMIGDSPHLYYMHFWSVGAPAAIGAALKDALGHINIKR